jgi:hypothetical protein
LNQTLWTLLIASLVAGAGWLVVVLTSRIELKRQELHREKFALSLDAFHCRGGLDLFVLGGLSSRSQPGWTEILALGLVAGH